MRYKIQPKRQLVPAAIGFIVVVILGYAFEGEVDWLNAGAVAVGVAIGMGFVRKNTEKTGSTDRTEALQYSEE